jgi:NAD(P)H dehydrogenase (quinone)
VRGGEPLFNLGRVTKALAYTSLLNADSNGVPQLAEHRITEKEIRTSGIPFVLLRNGWYIENYTENLAGPVSHGGFVGATQGGRISAASRADLAAAAAAVLTQDGHAGKTYELAGDRAFTMSELADVASGWAGKPLGYNELPPDAYKQVLLGAGLPEAFADFYLEADLAIARGELYCDRRDPRVLIGRDTQSIEDVFAALPRPSAD